MPGAGRGHTGVSVLNGVILGIGAALPLTETVEATWRPGPHAFAGPGGTVEAVERMLGMTAAVTTTSPWPPARGLKTSSAAAIALLRAATDLPTDHLARAAVRVGRLAKTTVTGAYDDALMAAHGRLRIGDNIGLHDLGPVPHPRWHVAVWVPEEARPKDRLPRYDPTLVPHAKRALARLRAGDVPGAMEANGDAMEMLHPSPAREVLRQHDALASSMSGTGPAVAGLFAAPVGLDRVTGGTWHWTVTHA